MTDFRVLAQQDFEDIGALGVARQRRGEDPHPALQDMREADVVVCLRHHCCRGCLRKRTSRNTRKKMVSHS